ncbi:hypothetical protein TRVL_00196 [Trypanosoma vivax]|uniref:Uncharacterized protein n=1 Tax=Trypanosoma vivax (strain Y486) TaxID=1055687 RepID=G0TYC0_TRYVY|nr:hypothetical protein TRVL_00196 [Trypanosoma vivax]CCC48967.1 hypothetical protein TVY486_0703010 [Trypanosoma vivax Y486]
MQLIALFCHVAKCERAPSCLIGIDVQTFSSSVRFPRGVATINIWDFPTYNRGDLIPWSEDGKINTYFYTSRIFTLFTNCCYLRRQPAREYAGGRRVALAHERQTRIFDKSITEPQTLVTGDHFNSGSRSQTES